MFFNPAGILGWTKGDGAGLWMKKYLEITTSVVRSLYNWYEVS